MKSICLIPARNSSTRFKNKNIAKWGCGNLITNAIDQAIDSYIFDDIILSSNDLSILDIAKNYNMQKVGCHYRDDTEDQLIGVIRQSIIDLDIRRDDTLFLLLVTCPLRTAKDIINAYNLFIENDREQTIVSVGKNVSPIQMSFSIQDDYLDPCFGYDLSQSTRKQDHNDTFYFNDAAIIDTGRRWMAEHRPHLYGKRPIPYIMPPERSIAIDYEFQLKMAEGLKEWKDGKI